MKHRIFRPGRGLAMVVLSCAAWALGSESLTLPAAEAGTSRCGELKQRACGEQDCVDRFGYAGFTFIPYQDCPRDCVYGLVASGGVCLNPPGSCDIECKMARIGATLGAPPRLQPDKTMYCFDDPFDPYGGRKVSRSDLGLPDTDRSVTIDIGGEGLYHDDEGRQWGSDQAINVNCSLNRTTHGDTKTPIKHLVFGFGENLPFADHFADTLLINNAPIFVSEIERVIRPGGRIKIGYVSGNSHLVETIIQHMCLSPVVTSFGFYNNVEIDVPADFDNLKPKSCKRRDEL